MKNTEHKKLASDIVKAINTSEAQTFKQLAKKLRVSTRLTSELCHKLNDNSVVRMIRFRSMWLVEIAPNMDACTEQEKENWVLGALNDDL